MWHGATTFPSSKDLRLDFLANESSSRRWCLVLCSTLASKEWNIFIRLALEKSSARVGRLNDRPLILYPNNALTSDDNIINTVRALCVADIVIVDTTVDDPVLFLLLGIRAAVRRSVTIACTKTEATGSFWDRIPFNLRELNVVSFYHEQSGLTGLEEAICAGLTQSTSSANYLDLPVYDYIRQPSLEFATAKGSHVLFLRAFGSYERTRKAFVETRIRSALKLSSDARVETVIEQNSRRLAGQRLYEAIRYWPKRVVDLTWWRPNVMFELGVCLAVRESETYCLIDHSMAGSQDFRDLQEALIKLLNPFSYDLNSQSFADAFARKISTVIFPSAASYFRWEQDQLCDYVDTMLVSAAAVTSPLTKSGLADLLWS